MLKRITVTLSKGLRKRLSERSADASLKKRVERALRIAGEVAAAGLGFIKSGDCSSYTTRTGGTGPQTILECVNLLAIVVARSERMVAFIAEGPGEVERDTDTVIFVTIALYLTKSSGRSWVDIGVRVNSDQPPHLLHIDDSVTRQPINLDHHQQ